MKALKTLTWIAIACSLSWNAQAELGRGLRLGYPSAGGSGCKQGTYSVTLSPDEDAISVLYDDFIAEAGNTTGRPVTQKSCNLAIPVTVPQGYSVAVIQVDHRGFNLVPSWGGRTRINTEYFWNGVAGPIYSRNFFGPANADYMESNAVMAESLVWTPCGASVNLRIRTSIMAQSNSRMDQTSISVDSSDVSSGMIYHLQWRRCGM